MPCPRQPGQNSPPCSRPCLTAVARSSRAEPPANASSWHAWACAPARRCMPSSAGKTRRQATAAPCTWATTCTTPTWPCTSRGAVRGAARQRRAAEQQRPGRPELPAVLDAELPRHPVHGLPLRHPPRAGNEATIALCVGLVFPAHRDYLAVLNRYNACVCGPLPAPSLQCGQVDVEGWKRCSSAGRGQRAGTAR